MCCCFGGEGGGVVSNSKGSQSNAGSTMYFITKAYSVYKKFKRGVCVSEEIMLDYCHWQVLLPCSLDFHGYNTYTVSLPHPRVS